MKIYFTLIIALLINVCGHGQCPEEEIIEFTSQIEIDNFILQYPNCTRLESEVILKYPQESGNPIQECIIDLGGLSKIEYIREFKIDAYCSSNVQYFGLDNLSKVGTLLLQVERFNRNDTDNPIQFGLESITDIESLTIMGLGTSTFPNLSFLPNLIKVKNIKIAADTSLEGLSSLNLDGGSLSITIHNYGNILISDLSTLLTYDINVDSLSLYLDTSTQIDFTGLGRIFNDNTTIEISSNTQIIGLENNEPFSINT